MSATSGLGIAPEAVDSFEAAYSDLFIPAMRLAYRLVGDITRAEDLAAEALARTYSRWEEVNGLEYRDAWVMRITTNLALDSLRRDRSLAKALAQMAGLREDVAEPASGLSDETAVRLALAEALRKLPRRQREVIVLRYLCEFDSRKIAGLLKMKESTIRTHVQRGLTALRGLLATDVEDIV